MLYRARELIRYPRFKNAGPAPWQFEAIGVALSVSVAYFLAARLGLFLLTKPDGVAVFWPAAGVSSGVLLALGPKARWPVAIGAIAGTAAANLMSDRSVWASIAFGLCNAGEALFAVWLIVRYVGSEFRLGRLRHVVVFMASALVATAASGICAAISYRLFHSSGATAFTIWQHWFTSDAIGIITVAPLIVGLAELLRERPLGRELIEGAGALIAVLVTTGIAIFLLPKIWWDIVVPVEVFFPPLLWIGARCRPIFTAAAVFIISLSLVSAITFELGHFGQPVGMSDRTFGAQVGIFGITVCALILATLFAERRQQATILIELIERLTDGERRMRAIVNTVADAIVTIDGEGTVETLNPVAARIFGYSPEEVIGQNVKMLMPEDYARMHDGHFANSVATGQAGMVGAGLELSGRRKDGSNFPMELAVSEMMVGGRRMFTGVVRDITERKKAEARQRLLIAELDHRVKNTLAQVSVVAASTRRESSSIDGYLQELDGRIQSMAAAHRLLSESGWEDVGLDNLVRSQLAPYALDANMEIRGKSVALKAAEIQAVAMVLHELVTNAAKYGSLSVPDGRVVVAWDLKPNNAKTILSIDWRELGGPPVVANGKPGYGTGLIRDLIPHELGGAVDLVFSAEGLSCRIEFPFEWPSAPGAFASLAVKA